MKILHICLGFNIEFQGGITNYVRNLATAQACAGNEVFVLTDKSQTPVSYEKDSFHVKEIVSTNGNWDLMKKEDKALYQDIQSFLAQESFDILHFHMVMNLDPRILPFFEKYPYVVSLHDYYYICPRVQMIRQGKSCQQANENCLNCFAKMEEGHLSRGIYHRVIPAFMKRHILVHSHRIVPAWRQAYYPFLEKAKALLPVSNRVQEIYQNSGIHGNFIMCHIGNFSADAFDFNYHYQPQDTLHVVILSSLSYIKGGPLLFSLLKQVHNPKLQFFFYGRSSAKEQQQMAEVGIQDCGTYKQTDLPKILARMDLGIMVPIWEDNGPQVVMEMLNNHVPVLATHMGGIPDFVNEKNGFLFDPNSAESCQMAVDFLNQLTSDRIASMKKAITPTCTPEEHNKAIQSIYDNSLSDLSYKKGDSSL